MVKAPDRYEKEYDDWYMKGIRYLHEKGLRLWVTKDGNALITEEGREVDMPELEYKLAYIDESILVLLDEVGSAKGVVIDMNTRTVLDTFFYEHGVKAVLTDSLLLGYYDYFSSDDLPDDAMCIYNYRTKKKVIDERLGYETFFVNKKRYNGAFYIYALRTTRLNPTFFLIKSDSIYSSVQDDIGISMIDEILYQGVPVLLLTGRRALCGGDGTELFKLNLSSLSIEEQDIINSIADAPIYWGKDEKGIVLDAFKDYSIMPASPFENLPSLVISSGSKNQIAYHLINTRTGKVVYSSEYPIYPTHNEKIYRVTYKDKDGRKHAGYIHLNGTRYWKE